MLRHATTAASTMCGGVGKSGSPAPKPITSSPAAWSALYFASTARVADSLIDPTRRETRLMRPWWHAVTAAPRRLDEDARFVPVGQVGEARIVREDLHHGDVEAETA